ncbi:hypothetical protein GALMADRAFT_102720 [Galerina marginata CBS 339.88]|uniref:Peptidase A1 domain-containing protein n=1 Tax=Galerina marginata (strain CBS 339.88) TaxID=685588 RepID=A0A067SUJ6_GALM3|nr:hypothetical protein GALMADRAFT_102720 [Galerina marginata CBS 339.88]
MTARPRLVVVEDTDSAIQYTGPWFQNTGTHANLGNIGSPSGGTLHGVNTNASFSFTFTGSEVTLYGTIDAPTTSSSGETDLTWACSVDGTSIASFDTSATPDNNLALCGSTSLSNVMHTLVLQATVSNSSKTFWFDELQYAPLAGVPLDNATVIVDFSDPAIQYGAGWTGINGGVTTQSTETGLGFDFVGTHLSWFGIPANTTGTLSRGADFSIDAAAPISVTLPTASGAVSIFNQLIFQTDQLSPGKHHIEVKHYLSTTPLSLQFFIIQNVTIPGTSSSGTSTVGPPPSSSSNSTSSGIPPGQPTTSSQTNSIPKTNSSTGAVVGGVVAGIIAIAGLLFLLFFLRRRKRRRRTVQPYNAQESAIPLAGVEPFMASPSPTATKERPWIPALSIPFQNPGKGVRAGQSPETSAVVSASDVGTTSLYGSSLPAGTLRHQDSGVRIPDGGEGSMVELPPLYTQR